jgi:acyl dehydratase
MEQTTYFEDYEIGAGRTTFGRTITETDFVVHAGHTGDFFPHHMDVEFMKASEFGQRIAHGTMVFAIGVGLTANVVNPVAFSYGYDRLRFIKPVFIGDTKRPRHGRVIERVEVINQRGEVVLATDHIYIVERRPEK